MNAMKPQVKEEEDVAYLTPEEEAMLEEAIAAADAGDLVEVNIIDGRLCEVRRPD
ncbi:MAG: hypothetical protein JWO97_185 [Acidobacteria bacterium]|nr:hypothetical protein [Acidobacteriota bacterium]